MNIKELRDKNKPIVKMRIVAVDYSMATKSMDIFFSGCDAEPRCTGCHNPEAWDFNVGKDWKQWIFQINDNVKKFGAMFDKFFLLGGEPLAQDPEEFAKIVSALKEYGKELWLFTHYELDEIPDDTKAQFNYIKTGRYLPELSTYDNISYGVRLATSNQKVHKRGVDYLVEKK